MEKQIFLSVIIPAYNEAERIVPTILETDGWLSRQGFHYEIIVVNDGSTDNTADIVKKIATKSAGIKLIDNFKNQGKGAVVKQGMLAARGEWRLFMDADNSTAISHFEKMLPLIKQGYDIIIGSRDSKDAKGAKQAVRQPWLKILFGNIGNLIIQFLAVPGIWDTQCGFKCFSQESAEKIFSQSLIKKWGFDVEALFLARKLGYRIGIIPVYWKNDPRSHVSWKGYVRTFKEVIQVKINWWRGRYKVDF